MHLPLIDIHTHHSRPGNDTVSVNNIFPGQEFAAFTGQNFYSVGLHPWHLKSKDENNEMLEQMEDALEFDHVIFVGECGPDKSIENDFSEQMRVFEAQAFMAEEYQKPLIIHCVKAYNEVIGLYNKIHPTCPGYYTVIQEIFKLQNSWPNEIFYFHLGKFFLNRRQRPLNHFSFCRWK